MITKRFEDWPQEGSILVCTAVRVIKYLELITKIYPLKMFLSSNRLRGATVARLTPDQKAACSNHVGVNYFFIYLSKTLIVLAYVMSAKI